MSNTALQPSGRTSQLASLKPRFQPVRHQLEHGRGDRRLNLRVLLEPSGRRRLHQVVEVGKNAYGGVSFVGQNTAQHRGALAGRHLDVFASVEGQHRHVKGF